MQTHSKDLIANGSTSSGAHLWPGGRGVFMAAANWAGGGSISLQVLLPDGTTYIDVGTNTTLTANGIGGFDLPPCKIKATVTGTVAAAYATVARVPA